MLQRIVVLVFCLGLLGWASPGYCWDGIGHELIAQIAYERLSPSAKVQVDRLSTALNDDLLTKQLPADELPVDSIDIATWPDEIRSLGEQTHQYSAWHFIDLDPLPPVPFDVAVGGLPGMPIADAATIASVKAYVDPNSDVYEQILAQSTILSNRGAATADRARALAFVEHFVGDIHQPLHAIGKLRGGNDYPIVLQTPDRTYTNLHAFWDSAYRYRVVNGLLVMDPHFAATESGLGASKFKAWADELAAADLPKDIKLLLQKDPAAWAVESDELATEFVFPADSSPTLTADYLQKATEIARERVALAGIRLSVVLNTLLTTPS